MAWHKMNTSEALAELIQKSNESPQLLFKHSTRCSISTFALKRLQPVLKNISLHVLDVIANRELSNNVSQQFNVVHQSPQLLIIHKETCIYSTSHIGISAATIENQLHLLNKKSN